MKFTSMCHVAFFFLLVLSLAGCARVREAADQSPEFLDEAQNELGRKPPAGQVQQAAHQGKADDAKKPGVEIERKIIYTASLGLVVEELDKAHKELTRLIKKYEGYVEENDVQGKSGTSRAASWKIRIPVKAFDEFREAILQLGEPERDSLQSRDVTEEYYDTEARLTNLQKVEKRFQELLDKAKEMKDAIAVENELHRVREDIERLQGKLKVLQNLTGMTTVHLHLQERRGYVPPQAPSFATTVGRTFEGSIHALVQLGQGLVLVVVALVPWLPVIAVLGIVIWWLTRARPAGRTSSPNPPPAG